LNDRSIDEIKARLNDLEDQVSSNTEELVAIKASASKKATAILAMGSTIFLSQFAVITVGTFHYLSWDIMEPVSYLMMYGNFVCGFTYYLKVKKDLTAENIHEVFAERFKRNAAKRAGIDLEK
jgi:DNA polymerase II small subunit/DNA polymerase delta subunit B